MIAVNNRPYRLPRKPTVVVCIDGCEPEYIAQAVAHGRMPWLKQVLAEGTALVADCTIPSCTNPNNLSIVTGVPPSVHGICGDYLFDVASGTDVMMTDPTWLRAPTLLAAVAEAGRSVAVVTAKDELCKLLGHGMKGICISAEKADEATIEANGMTGVLDLAGMALPSVHSAELSEFVLAAGVQLMARAKGRFGRPDLMYLSTTDHVQHEHAPGTAGADAFFAMIDVYLGRLDAMGCVVALTADHGMNPKTRMDGQPDVVFLQDVLDSWLGAARARVIVPITDPYAGQHGALGSFATVYLPHDVDTAALLQRLRGLRGIESVHGRADAAERFELPADRIGDAVVLSERFTALGTSASRHDLGALVAPLRSHGGVSEQRVPLILNRAIHDIDTQRRWRNFDAFDLALNHAQ